MKHDPPADIHGRHPLLVVVEGANDIDFLCGISRILSGVHSDIEDLGALAKAGNFIFLPFGGGRPELWVDRLAPLQCRELHLFDRETPPETANRLAAAAQVNARDQCWAYVTGKRSLENYLHPKAISAAGGGEVQFAADDCVGSVVARWWHERAERQPPWNELTPRARSRFAYRAKRWLNTTAVSHMQPPWLYEADAAGEVIGWLRHITRLATNERCSR